MGKKVILSVSGVFCLCVLFCASTDAVFIQGTSVATEITADDIGTVPEGVEVGWYKYTMEISWDLNGQGDAISHWDLIVRAECTSEDHVFVFGGYQDPVSGQSTSEDYPDEPYTVNWFGYLSLEGDPPTGIPGPLIKYEQPVLDQYGDPIPPAGDPGADGHGTFWYYSNVIPQNGPDGNGQESWENVLVAKGGTTTVVWGDLTGDAPSCQIVPEPATLGLVLFADLVLLRRRPK